MNENQVVYHSGDEAWREGDAADTALTSKKFMISSRAVASNGTDMCPRA